MALKPIKIKYLSAREILDSRGHPTVEAELVTSSGVTVNASVPSGASRGKHEAEELRDNEKRRYRGRGVLKAVNTIRHTIAPRLKGRVIKTPQALDAYLIKLDGTKTKKKLGGNTILAVSLAGAKAFAEENKLPLYRYLNRAYGCERIQNLPTPMLNIFNGGKHADTNLDIQELMVVPKRKKLFSEKLRIGTEIFYALKDVLKSSGFDTDTGDEGGYAPKIHASIEALRMILLAIKDAGYSAGREVFLALDVGAGMLFDQRRKHYRFKLDASFYSASQMITLYEVWAEQFPLLSIEDGLSDDDWRGWSLLTERLGRELMIVGDDLFVTSKQRLQKGIEKKAANAIIIKPNQVGTLSETFETIALARGHGITIIVSHRSGETNDSAIADIAVAAQAAYVKFGAPNRGERVSKYNRLTEIEDEIITGIY